MKLRHFISRPYQRSCYWYSVASVVVCRHRLWRYVLWL